MCLILLVVVVLSILFVRVSSNDIYKEHQRLLAEHGWHNTTLIGESRQFSGGGLPSDDGVFSVYVEYITTVRGIIILPEDQLRIYDYQLAETGVVSPLHAYILEKNGEIACATVLGIENIESTDYLYWAVPKLPALVSPVGINDSWDISTPVEVVQKELIQNMRARVGD